MTKFLCFLFVLVVGVNCQSNILHPGTSGCSEDVSEETTKIFLQCGVEVEAIIKKGGIENFMEEGTVARTMEKIRKRRGVDITGASLSPLEKRVSGCILHCGLGKYGVVGQDGIPTKKGLIDMMRNGEPDRAFAKAAPRWVDQCYKPIQNFLKGGKTATYGEKCDLMFDYTTCVGVQVQHYCQGKN